MHLQKNITSILRYIHKNIRVYFRKLYLIVEHAQPIPHDKNMDDRGLFI